MQALQRDTVSRTQVILFNLMEINIVEKVSPMLTGTICPSYLRGGLFGGFALSLPVCEHTLRLCPAFYVCKGRVFPAMPSLRTSLTEASPRALRICSPVLMSYTESSHLDFTFIGLCKC